MTRQELYQETINRLSESRLHLSMAKNMWGEKVGTQTYGSSVKYYEALLKELQPPDIQSVTDRFLP